MKAPHQCKSLDDIRHEIDIIDHEIIGSIGRRFNYVKEVMRFKTTEADVRAPERYQSVLNQRRLWAQEAGLPPDVIEEIYRSLIDYFIDHELEELTRVGADRA